MASSDAASFETLAMPHLELLYRVARRLTGSEHSAEDLVQETYLKAFQAFDRFELREFGIRPWLLRIMHNAFLNRRAREIRRPASLEAAAEAADDSDRPGAALPELDYERLDEEVKQAVENLSPEFRTVLILWATRELSYQEIADMVGVPIGTVMSRLHRARQQLVRNLSEYARANRLTA